MSVTFQNLQDKLGDWLTADTTRLPAAVRQEIINMSIREILRDNDLRFGEFTASYSLPSGTLSTQLATIVSGATFSRPLAVWFYDTATGKRKELKQIQRETFTDKYLTSSPATGTLTDFAIWNESMFFGPPPSATTTIYVDFYGFPADLSAAGDHTDFTDTAYEAILWLSLARASKYLLEDERVEVFMAEYREALGRLQREHRRMLRSATRVVSTEAG